MPLRGNAAPSANDSGSLPHSRRGVLSYDDDINQVLRGVGQPAPEDLVEEETGAIRPSPLNRPLGRPVPARARFAELVPILLSSAQIPPF